MRRAACVLFTTLLACGSAASAGAPAAERDPRTLRQPPLDQGSADDTQPAPAPAGVGAPYPIVFLHGMSGFGKLELGPVSITYFDGVVADLAQRGEQVFVTVVPPYDTSEARAQELSKQIDQILARTGKAKVNLVGHSQGGMDARVIASPAGLGYGDRIASVTTIATPHRGSRVADAVLGLTSGVPTNVIDDVTTAVLDLVEKSAYELKSDPHLRAQVEELSETYATTVFNPKYKDDPRVAYASYAGRTNNRSGAGVCDDGKLPNDAKDLDTPQVALAVLAAFLEEGSAKVNDGLVTVESAKWGTFLRCVPADHLKEVGQLPPVAGSFDHLGFFRDVVAQIRAGGH